MNAAYMADRQAGRINKADTSAVAETLPQIGTQRYQGRRHPLNKALVADQEREGILPKATYHFGVEGLEVSIGGLIKSDKNRQHLAQAESARSVSVLQTIREELPLPLRLKDVTKVIDRAKEGF